MRPPVITTIALALCTWQAHAQLVIPVGAGIKTSNGAIITLKNMDLVNNGTISQLPGDGKFVFSGSSANTISGTGSALFDTMEIAKTGGAAIKLQQSLTIGSGIHFTSGLVDLYGYTISLQPNATLYNESETSRITGVSGGSLRITNPAVNSPDSFNAGNIGASITAAQNLGALEIDRIHQPAVNPGNPAFTGIQRTFLVIPANNAALNATLRFYYFAAELNGKDENTLTLWKSTDGINWARVGADSRNSTTHYVEKTGIPDFSWWTLSDDANALPLVLLSFKTFCHDDVAILDWQTADETNAASFIIEKSKDGILWTELQRIAAENNPAGASYSCQDAVPGATVYYRLKMVDRSGQYTYSPVVSGSCTAAAMPLVAYPNPARNAITVSLSVRQNTQAKLLLYSATGRLISRHVWDLQAGLNKYVLPELATLAGGNYFITVVLNGSILQTQFSKQ